MLETGQRKNKRQSSISKKWKSSKKKDQFDSRDIFILSFKNLKSKKVEKTEKGRAFQSSPMIWWKD